MGDVIEFQRTQGIARVTHVRLAPSVAPPDNLSERHWPVLLSGPVASPEAPLPLDPETEILLYRYPTGTAVPKMRLEQNQDGTQMLVANNIAVARIATRRPKLTEVVLLELTDERR